MAKLRPGGAKAAHAAMLTLWRMKNDGYQPVYAAANIRMKMRQARMPKQRYWPATPLLLIVMKAPAAIKPGTRSGLMSLSRAILPT
jgi:hypothetical protein